MLHNNKPLNRSDSYDDQVVYDFVTAEDGSRLEPPSRACDACRKMKIRCIDKENPPCKRCRHMKLQCRFAVPPVPRAVYEENEATKNRLESLEGHVSGIYSKLEDISSALLRLAPQTPSDTASPSLARHQQHGSASSSTAHHPLRPPLPRGQSLSQTNTPGTQDSHYTRWQGDGLAEPVPSAAPRPGMVNQSQSMDNMPLPRPNSTGDARGPGTSSPHPSMQRGASAPAVPRTSSPTYEDHDDPLQSAMVNEPFREITRREEELCLIAEQHDPATIPRRARRPSHGIVRDVSRNRLAKRRRVDGEVHVDEEDDVDGEGAEDWAPLPIREKGDPLRHDFDPVRMGLCTEEEGKALFQEFFKYAHPFMPIFDPREDTWEHVRRRSPFCITVILMVALRARESAGPPSELSNKCREEAEKMAKATLFEPIATLETLQGLILMIAWGQHAWRICCHAMALAVDMRLYRCLPYLHKIRTDSQNPNHMLERQRPLVVGARLWLALVKQTYEMSYNHALPILFPSPHRRRTAYSRGLLDHPLSTIYDSRLVISVEIHEVREGAFRPYESIATLDQAEMDDMLRSANQGINDLYDYWIEYYHRMGLSADHFLMMELTNQRAYAIMFTNAPAWYGVHKQPDVHLLSHERQQWIAAAVRSGAYLISTVSNKQLEKDSEFGNHNFHVGIVATARYLIRMVELLPGVVDLYQVSLDIDRLLIKLPYYPVQPFADGLRRTLIKAREQGILPHTTLTEEAARQPTDLPPPPKARPGTPGSGISEFPGFNPFPWNDPIQPGNPMATASLSMTRASIDATDAVRAATAIPENVPWPEVDFNLSDWFPAPDDPLGMLPVDTSALDGDMSNWFPAAPQVWMDDSAADLMSRYNTGQ